MSDILPPYVVAWAHVSINAFLLHSLRKHVVSGLSFQTLMAMTFYAFLLLCKKLYWPLYYTFLGEEFMVDEDWNCETAAHAVNACVMLCCVKVASASKDKTDDGHAQNTPDDFASTQFKHFWLNTLGRPHDPPLKLHYLLIYLVTFVTSAVVAWASRSFNLFVFLSWARSRPTAMMAIYANFLRGFGLLPQLHLSRGVGVVSAPLALWITACGLLDIFEMLSDGIFDTSKLCYTSGDLFAAALVSDFALLCIKSRLRGQKDVEIPEEYRDVDV